MFGRAQKQFLEKKEGKILDLLREEEWITPLETAAIHSIRCKTEEEELSLSFLLSAARQGHLCVTISPLKPSLKEVWPGHFSLEAQVASGFETLEHPFIVREGKNIYLHRFFRAEKEFVEHFQRLIAVPPKIPLSEEVISSYLEKETLLPEQKAAILSAAREPITILCGGPGTGKTYTAAKLIECLWRVFPDGATVVLAAPTGKAAANLQKSMERVRGQVSNFPEVQAKTLHSLLGVWPGKKREKRRISADLLLVDECSMIDVEMMGALFSSVREGTRLILLGDSYQLPPVEAGSLFRDLQFLMKRAGRPISELTTCLRAEYTAIVDLASLVHQGKTEEVLQVLDSQRKGVRGTSFSSPTVKGQQREIVSYVKEHFPKENPPLENEKIAEFLKKYCLLTPLRRGSFGAQELNALIAEEIGGAVHPILVTRNHPRLGLFNGDIGLSVGNRIYFPGETLRSLPAILIEGHSLAYALSVHKSQGSEYDHVTLLLPEGAERFGRELLYTGITRAKKQIDLWGREEELRRIIEKPSFRNSGVCK